MTTTVTNGVLTRDEIAEILAGGRTTTYKPTIINFVKSEELYLNVMELVPFNSKKVDSVYNSFNNNLKTLKVDNPDWPHIELRKTNDGKVLLINLTLLQGDMDEDEDEPESDEDE